MNTKEYIDKELANYSKIKVKYLDDITKNIVKENKNIEDLQYFLQIKENYYLRRIYFQVHLIRCQNIKEQFDFIEQNLSLLLGWEDTDMILTFLSKKACSSYIFFKARLYIKQKEEFIRRLGYVLLLHNVYKEEVYLNDIFSLIDDDNRYYVLMAQAWLISYLYIVFPEKTYDFIKNSKLSYKLKSKSISKITDSYRVNEYEKNKVRKLRTSLNKDV